MEVRTRVWLGGINPPKPYLKNGYPDFDFKAIEDVASFTKELRSKDVVLISDMNSLALKCLRASRALACKRVLIRNEPEVVCPANYLASNISGFDTVVDIGRTLATSSFTMPYAIEWPEATDLLKYMNKPKRESVIFMNSNKLSFVKGELYSLRRTVLQNLEISVYGPGWSSSVFRRLKILVGELIIFLGSRRSFALGALKFWFASYRRYFGLAANKPEVLSGYKVALTIENSEDYMSEKLLDALLAGCIPVYVGPPPSQFGIPESLVFKAEPNLKSVAKQVECALDTDFDTWKGEALNFLQKNSTRDMWSQDRIYREILDRAVRDKNC